MRHGSIPERIRDGFNAGWLAVLLGVAVLFLLGGCTGQSEELALYQKKDVLVSNRDQILGATPAAVGNWSRVDILNMRSLWLGSLGPPRPDPSNAVADNPRAAALGHRLFFDTRLSANQQVSCATCHLPELLFTDGRAVALGTDLHTRNTMTIIGTAYNPWLLWDGHKDSQWAQALDPIEAPNEQGSTRLHALHLIGKDEAYRSAYEALFGPLPDLSDFDRFPDAGGPVDYPPYHQAWEKMSPADQQTATAVFANLGKAIAAYERLILPGPSRFDSYVEAVAKGDTRAMSERFTPDEEAGLRLFLGEGDCLRCHHGPLFTDQLFHNTGVPAADTADPDQGRAQGAERVLADEFNCLSRYSDASESDCNQLQSIVPDDRTHLYAFKTPTLRNVAETGPYMHAGQLASLAEVLAHYHQAPPAPLGQTELQPLDLSEKELAQLEAFLRTLSAPPAVPPELLAPLEK